MSLKVTGASGALAVGTTGGNASAAGNNLAGLPALFAALLAGQTAAPDGGTATFMPQAATDDKKENADDGKNLSVSPADPNVLLLFLTPPIPPPIVSTIAVPHQTNEVTANEVMDTAPAPAQPGLQSGSELLPQTMQQSVSAPHGAPAQPGAFVVPPDTSAVPQVKSSAVPDTAGVAPPALTAGASPPVTKTNAPVLAAADGTAAMSPAGAQAARPVALLPGKDVPGAQAVTAAPITANVQTTTAVVFGSTPNAAFPQTEVPVQSAVPTQTEVSAQETAVSPQIATPTNPALQNPLAPANNTGRSLERQAQKADTAQALTASAPKAAADVSHPETLAPPPSSKDAGSEPKSAGASDVLAPAQAPNFAPHAVPIRTRGTEGRGTAARQVADEIVSLKLAPGATRQVVVNLHPRDWGQVRVEVTQAPPGADGAAGAVTARLWASSPEARGALEASSGELRRALADAGLRLDSVTVSADAAGAVLQSAAASADNGAPFRQGDGGQQNFAGQSGTAFAGGQNTASGGGGGGSPSQQGHAASGPTWANEPEAVRPELPRTATSKASGVDIRA